MFKPVAELAVWAPVILRVFLGLLFFIHGSQKMFGAFGGAGIAGTAAFFEKFGIFPGLFWTWVVTIVEFFGGIFLVFGFLTRIAAGLLVIDMLVAIARVHWPNFIWFKGGYEFPLTLAVIALTVFFWGPGTASIDKATGLEK
jgi:putative oxidoreductase